MKPLLRAYDSVIFGLAAIAGVLLAVMSIIIVYDAMLRTFRLGAAVWAIDVTGIALVYMTFFASPWLLRMRGHVTIEILVAKLSPALQADLWKLVCGVCALMCLYLAYKSLWVTIEGIGEADSSAIQAPRWIRFAPMPVGFLFLGTEFLRFLFSRETFRGTQGSLE